ncbi:MAG: phospholipid carrier-dependent glycosyltransferase, partial [Candidatus Omnitrophica bacterium]|nr:phospholipid carrier-dependent glycosyltransferase [Candidatus Omnitrophota bacterium]
MPKSIPWRDIAFALFIFAVAFLIRSYDLGRLPLNHDEASAARHLLGWPGLFKEFCGVPKFALSFFSEPLASLLTREASGPKTYVPEAFVFFIRSGHVLFGALTVSSLFLFARDMYGRLTAMIASVLLCFLPWHIAQSRLAGLVTQVPLLGCLMLWGP